MGFSAKSIWKSFYNVMQQHCWHMHDSIRAFSIYLISIQMMGISQLETPNSLQIIRTQKTPSLAT